MDYTNRNTVMHPITNDISTHVLWGANCIPDNNWRPLVGLGIHDPCEFVFHINRNLRAIQLPLPGIILIMGCVRSDPEIYIMIYIIK